MTKQTCTKVVSLIMKASTEALNIDAGTQFKIFNRLHARMNDGFENEEESALVELLDWLAFEVAQARTESV